MTFDPDICPKSLIISGHDPSTKPGKHCGWCGQLIPLPTPEYDLDDQDMIWHQRYRLGRGNE